MVGGSSEKKIEGMDTGDDFPERKGELKLNQLKPFIGKREELKKFLQDVILYLQINKKVYDTDKKKIAFALSFMSDGDAGSYKVQLLEDAMGKTTFDLGTWNNFMKDLTEAFSPYNAPGDALEEMKALHMRDSSIEEHNAQNKILVTQSGLDETSPAVIDYYLETLSVPLQRRILLLRNPSKTLKEWYDWASKLENNWKKTQRILGWS